MSADDAVNKGYFEEANADTSFDATNYMDNKNTMRVCVLDSMETAGMVQKSSSRTWVIKVLRTTTDASF